MKKRTVVALLLVAGEISLAADKHPNEILTVLASVHFDIGKPRPSIVFCAKGLASRMFAKAGVGVTWYRDLPGANRNLPSILIEISPNAAERGNRDLLAYTHPFRDNHITIFWDRLEGTYNDAIATVLLAHVLVHEITHILQRSDHHSEEGIMKAQWTARDMWQMRRKPLSFEPSDVRLIHAGLAARGRASEGIPEQISAP